MCFTRIIYAIRNTILRCPFMLTLHLYQYTLANKKSHAKSLLMHEHIQINIQILHLYCVYNKRCGFVKRQDLLGRPGWLDNWEIVTMKTVQARKTTAVATLHVLLVSHSITPLHRHFRVNGSWSTRWSHSLFT